MAASGCLWLLVAASGYQWLPGPSHYLISHALAHVLAYRSECTHFSHAPFTPPQPTEPQAQSMKGVVKVMGTMNKKVPVCVFTSHTPPSGRVHDSPRFARHHPVGA